MVAARKAEYARHKLLCPPPVIVGRYHPAAPKPVAAGPQASGPSGECRSVRGSSPAKPASSSRPMLPSKCMPGEILVAPYTDPGWTPYFLAAAGLVVDVGGMLSHGSVVAREYGLPAMVNVGPATRLIKTGQRLQVMATAARSRSWIESGLRRLQRAALTPPGQGGLLTGWNEREDAFGRRHQEALKAVKYPGYSRDMVSFGLVKQIAAKDGAVSVAMQLRHGQPGGGEPDQVGKRTGLEGAAGGRGRPR